MGGCRCKNTGPSEVKGCALDGASGHEKRGVYRYWIWVFAQYFYVWEKQAGCSSGAKQIPRQ